MTLYSEEYIMIERNGGTPYNSKWVDNININYPAVVRAANEFKGRRVLKKEHQAAWLLRAVTVIDLTTLAGDDTSCNVDRLSGLPIQDFLIQG
jgi:deoxyribose-phosphate aldolase